MNRRINRAFLTLLLALPVLPARAQDGADAPPRPPEVERLRELGRDPDRLRQALTDPKQVQDLMRLMESDTVRQYFRDPQHLRELMSEIDVNQIREVVQSVDPTILRRAALSRYLERLRQQLKATEEEWKVLGPRVEKLLLAQQDVRAGIRGVGGFGFGGGGGGLGNFSGAQMSEIEEAAADLRDAAQDPDVNAAEAKRRLVLYRRARDKARERLQAAEREVKELLTQRQEGLLVMLGVLN